MRNRKERREQLGISQKELADACGITQSHLCDIEQGRNKPSIDVAVRIARVLKVRSIKFFEQQKGGEEVDVQALYDALAIVLGQRENVNIKITVEREKKDEEND